MKNREPKVTFVAIPESTVLEVDLGDSDDDIDIDFISDNDVDNFESESEEEIVEQNVIENFSDVTFDKVENRAKIFKFWEKKILIQLIQKFMEKTNLKTEFNFVFSFLSY